MQKEPTLCDFNRVMVSIPRTKLLKLYYKRSYLDADDKALLTALLWQVESATNKLLHVQSIVEKALLK